MKKKKRRKGPAAQHLSGSQSSACPENCQGLPRAGWGVGSVQTGSTTRLARLKAPSEAPARLLYPEKTDLFVIIDHTDRTVLVDTIECKKRVEISNLVKEYLMATPRLRIYYGPEDRNQCASSSCSTLGNDRVTVPLGEVFRWLVDAVHTGRTWLHDFEDDEVTIPADLY